MIEGVALARGRPKATTGCDFATEIKNLLLYRRAVVAADKFGETDIVQDQARVQESYSADKWKRLEEIRAKYDPDGLFFGFLVGLGTS